MDLETRTIRILCATDYEYWLRFLQVYRKIKQAEVFLRHCVGTAREMDGETERVQQAICPCSGRAGCVT